MAKTYINGVFIREHEFKDGSTVLNVSIPADKLDALFDQLQSAAKDGWIKLRITRNREPKLNQSGRVIATHGLAVDDWQPGQQRNGPAAPSTAAAGFAAAKAAVGDAPELEDVPF